MRYSVSQDIDTAVRTYHYLSERWFTHASPTLFNAGTPRPQLSSCFLIAMKARARPRRPAGPAHSHEAEVLLCGVVLPVLAACTTAVTWCKLVTCGR